MLCRRQYNAARATGTARYRQKLVEKSSLPACPASTGQKSTLAETQDRFIAHWAIAGHNVVLIDDVMTTGATARAAARACVETGARSVAVWCLARTPAPFAVE